MTPNQAEKLDVVLALTAGRWVAGDRESARAYLHAFVTGALDAEREARAREVAALLAEVEDLARVCEATSELHTSADQLAAHVAARARAIINERGLG